MIHVIIHKCKPLTEIVVMAAMALFGLSAEAVTIDPGVGVAASPAKITGNVDVDVFSGIVTMDPLNDYVGTTRITNGTLIASKLAPAGTASSIGSSGFVDVGNAIFRYTGTEAVTTDRVFTNTVSILASTGTVVGSCTRSSRNAARDIVSSPFPILQ